MIKFSSNSDWSFNLESVEIIRDEDQLIKRASAKHLLKYAKTKGQTDIHLIALGSSEGYGANRNGDEFSEADCIKNNHYFKDADRAVHRHHKNKKTDPKYGNIKAAAYNPKMRRIELMVGLDDDKCQDILEEQEKTGNTNWSMASFQPDGDYCLCGHNAKTDKDRCFAAGTLIELDKGYKKIEDIAVGDLVKTHTGQYKPVEALLPSNFTGEMAEIATVGNYHKTYCTANHPFYTINGKEFNKNYKQLYRKENPFWCKLDNGRVKFNECIVPQPKWAPVSELEEGDFIGYPIRAIDYSLDMSADEAYLLGLFLGDGNLIWGTNTGDNFATGITLSLGTVEKATVIAKVTELCDLHEYKYRINEREGINCVAVHIRGHDIGKRCQWYCGSLFNKKYLNEEVFAWSIEAKLAFLSGVLDSDGSVDKIKKSARIVMANEFLVNQLKDLSASVGLIGKIGKQTVFSGYSKACGSTRYILQFNQSQAAAFSMSQKTKGLVFSSIFHNMSFIAGGYLWSAITDLTFEDVENTPVYNFEVEEDHSYIANCLAAHNCEHIPRDLGTLNKEGQMYTMKNPNPIWKEISYVHRPADRIGMALGKEASINSVVKPMMTSDYLSIYTGFELPPEEFLISKQAEDKKSLITKLAEMEKHLDAVGKSPMTNKNSFIKRQEKLKQSPSIPDKDIDELRKHEAPKGLRAMADKGIVMSPEEFMKYIFGERLDDGLNKGIKSHLPHAFSKMDDDDAQKHQVANDEKYEPDQLGILPPELKQLVGKLFEGHSMFGEPSVKRVMRITIEMGPHSKDNEANTKPPKVESSKAEEKLAEAYSCYKLATLNYLQGKGLLTDEVLWNTLIQNR